MTVLAGVLVGLVSIGAAAWWVLAGANGPIERTRLDAHPAVRPQRDDDRSQAPGAGHRPVGWHGTLLGARRRPGAGWATPIVAWPSAARRPPRAAVDDLVVRLVAGTADSDIGPQLSDLGIGYIWVTGATDDVTSRIDNTPGLGVASGNDQGTVWQLDPAGLAGRHRRPPTASARVGALPATIPAGDEAASCGSARRRIRAGRPSVDGRRLEPGRRRLAAGVRLPADRADR